MVSHQINRHTTPLLPPLGEVADDPYAAGAVASADATLVELQLGADDAVAARAYALPPHAHRAAVRPTLGPVHHLQGADRRRLASACTRSSLAERNFFERTL